jgi:hypothetical protein
MQRLTLKSGASIEVDLNAWLKYVDIRLANKFCGLTHNDLVDWTWADAFEDGCSPSEAVNQYLEDNDPNLEL